jgi:3-methyl-2-oxobutanoate hydroxymethyltransferase
MRKTPREIFERKTQGGKLVVLTAYDYPSAKILDEEGVDIVLVGDSLGMVLLGYDNTLSVTMEDMIHHTKAVSRAVKCAMVVTDMPVGSYPDADTALQNARRLIREGGADAVKLEGGEKVIEQVSALIEAGIPVMGHVGMLPQSVDKTQGFRVQGKTREDADKILNDAVLLDGLGVFAVIAECVPKKLGAEMSRKLRAPVIGIGAGPADGQVLVLQDLLGFRGKVKPKFVRVYAHLDEEIRKAVRAYRADVLSGCFPSDEESY